MILLFRRQKSIEQVNSKICQEELFIHEDGEGKIVQKSNQLSITKESICVIIFYLHLFFKRRSQEYRSVIIDTYNNQWIILINF
jgi:hypothetical protein